jgi:hypothetical protein
LTSSNLSAAMMPLEVEKEEEAGEELDDSM